MKKLFVLTNLILFSLFLISCGNKTNYTSGENWLDAPSLKEAFVDGGYFDRFGLACEYREISNSSIRAGLAHHVNTTTSGNELKPDYILGGNSPISTTDFTDSAGKTIKVPSFINFSANMDPFLNAVKAAGLQMRGHVLTWHSQTPDWFFDEDYNTNNGLKLVDKETMTARHEWYIKSVLEHVNEWEATNGYGVGNHIIYSWDVVNEAVADDAANNNTGYLRGSTSNTKNKTPDKGGSRWYQIYGNEEFIINAFRFANAYAPADVTLCYNDYNEYLNYDDGKGGSWKQEGIVRLITAIKNGEPKTINGKSVKPRIDAMGMQSHVEPSWMSVNSYENALTRFLRLGLDVQITEFDIATVTEDDTTNWKNYFEMFKKYGKKGSEYNGHYITGITIWGINDENSWISNRGAQFPLLFKKSGGEIVTKNCFYSVLNTVN